jgi:hypothetical protein
MTRVGIRTIVIIWFWFVVFACLGISPAAGVFYLVNSALLMQFLSEKIFEGGNLCYVR